MFVVDGEKTALLHKFSTDNKSKENVCWITTSISNFDYKNGIKQLQKKKKKKNLASVSKGNVSWQKVGGLYKNVLACTFLKY